MRQPCLVLTSYNIVFSVRVLSVLQVVCFKCVVLSFFKEIVMAGIVAKEEIFFCVQALCLYYCYCDIFSNYRNYGSYSLDNNYN